MRTKEGVWSERSIGRRRVRDEVGTKEGVWSERSIGRRRVRDEVGYRRNEAEPEGETTTM